MLSYKPKMLTGEIKPGDNLLFAQDGKGTAQILVVSVLEFYGEKVILVSIDKEMPVQISEEFLRERCTRSS